MPETMRGQSHAFNSQPATEFFNVSKRIVVFQPIALSGREEVIPDLKPMSR